MTPPNVKILRLDYPSSAERGQTVSISWMVINYGGDYNYECFVRLVDLDTGATLKDERYRFSPGAGGGKTWSFTMPNRNWRLSFRCGYSGTIVTDSRNFTITLAAPPPPPPPPPPEPPNVKIRSLNYPSSAEQGATVSISWSVLNYGGDSGYECFVRLVDLDTGATLKDERYRFSPGAGVGKTWTFTMPNKNWRLSFRCGYSGTTTDSRNFTIELAAPPPPTPPPWTPAIVAPIILGTVFIFVSGIR